MNFSKFLAAFFLGSFENNYFRDNQVFLSLSFFIPLIMATAGNVGIQSSSIVIQSLSNPSAFENTVSERLFKVIEKEKCSHRDSNPGLGLERATSLAGLDYRSIRI